MAESPEDIAYEILKNLQESEDASEELSKVISDDLADGLKESAEATKEMKEDLESILDFYNEIEKELSKILDHEEAERKIAEALKTVHAERKKQYEESVNEQFEALQALEEYEGTIKRLIEHEKVRARVRAEVAASPEAVKAKIEDEHTQETMKWKAEAEERRQRGFLGTIAHASGAHERPTDIPTMMGQALGGIGHGTAGNIGAALGAGLGPIGAMGGRMAGAAVGAAPELYGKTMGMFAEGAAVGIKGLEVALKGLQGPLGPIGAGLDVLALGLGKVRDVIKAIPLVGTVLGPLADVAAGIPSMISGITNSLIGMAEKANPGVFVQWKQALEDTQGVIGQSFVPILDIMRQGVRLFADVLANIFPTTGEVNAALAELRAVFKLVEDEVRAVMAVVGPSIREMLIDGLRQLAHWAAVAVRAIGMLAERLRSAFGGRGAASTVAEGARSSYGAAARPVSMGGIEEYQKQLQMLAFKGPGGSLDEEAKKATIDMKAIEMEARDLLAGMEKVWATISSWAQKAWEVIQNIWKALVVITESVIEIANFLTKAPKKGVDAMQKVAQADAMTGGPLSGIVRIGAMFEKAVGAS